jgi:predicted ArsR family transcriptional regulator
MKSTRERVLLTLLNSPRCTIHELAEAVNINPISVRHHIARLQADGLVDSEEERHGVGRPRRVYYLTETGMERFPTRYVQMSIRLLDQMKQYVPQDVVRSLFVQMAGSLLDEHADSEQLDQLGIEQRLQLVKEVLTREGFSVEVEKIGDEYHIRETSCPYLQIGHNHPEICTLDQALITNVLSVPPEKVRCILNGDAHCTYVIPSNLIANDAIQLITETHS